MHRGPPVFAVLWPVKCGTDRVPSTGTYIHRVATGGTPPVPQASAAASLPWRSVSVRPVALRGERHLQVGNNM